MRSGEGNADKRLHQIDTFRVVNTYIVVILGDYRVLSVILGDNQYVLGSKDLSDCYLNLPIHEDHPKVKNPIFYIQSYQTW